MPTRLLRKYPTLNIDIPCVTIAPEYTRELVSLKAQGAYNLRSISGILLATPSVKTRVTLDDRSFQVTASKHWNALPREFRAKTHVNKCHLKTHLFNMVHTGLMTFYSRTFQGLLIIFKESISTGTISHFFYSHSKKAIPVRTNNVVQPKDRIV